MFATIFIRKRNICFSFTAFSQKCSPTFPNWVIKSLDNSLPLISRCKKLLIRLSELVKLSTFNCKFEANKNSQSQIRKMEFPVLFERDTRMGAFSEAILIYENTFEST